MILCFSSQTWRLEINYLGGKWLFLMIMISCLCLLRHPVLQVKETHQKICFDILKPGNSGFIPENDTYETEDEVLALAAEVILTGIHMCLIKSDFHLSNWSFSHSRVFCCSHSSQAVWDSKDTVARAGKVESNSMAIHLTLPSQQTEQESVKSPPAMLYGSLPVIFAFICNSSKEVDPPNQVICLLHSERFLLKLKVLSVSSLREKTNIGI